ncbi:hypothetical protein F443_08987 [Phytophthora nicotianae P1569]|uniref:6-pyruvoyltetrahydropterin synthase n=1 Tax=Phytophthora nicotianae P1569 TaxID=1317065 RepID=V9F522_PHYNI|nr:hypothetical protein F443_08987 [Phytophthora nicotianae P1569]
MGKELAVDRAPAMKTRGEADGIVKCCYLDKENTENYRAKPFERVKPPIQQCNGAGGPAIDYTKQKVTDVPMIVTVPPHPVAVGFNQLVKVHVSKDYMKFNAAHFIAFKGFREKLHGHNYRLAVTITGQVGSDGYVVDFGEIKRISRVICKDLNESFIVPMKSDALKISCDGKNIQIITEDMAAFSFPKADCSLLPIVHSSAEELAIHISNELVAAFTLDALLERGVRKLEVSISEADQQFASYERVLLTQNI